MSTIKVTVWNEYRHERHNEEVKAVYPEGIHTVLANYLNTQEDMEVRTAVLDEPEHGLTSEVLEQTDVLLWWGHLAHEEVSDEIVQRVRKKVLNGMGLIVLHSGHNSKIFHALMGTNTGALKWRDDGEKERIWVIEPGHPIAKGLGEYIEIPKEEMYGERFEIPAPDELIFISWFEGGEVFRSGCCYKRGQGNIFYFRPGHETFPVYHQPEVLQVISNSVRWAAKSSLAKVSYGRVAPLELIP
ncbi:MULTISPECIES: ThuA domain-containing protein [Paenibacillus]|uniref:Trehalose utilization protein n=1 Tax=Paenibacillus typhae TaxID=1174501 RepID=A0A1G8YRN6_9BACL|nr:MULTISPECIES: ThuA domain-containing protein [Paenibacillus]MBY0011559.1 ThuA domain-containing protein [Paenibacillus typhae]MEC0369821.1 ThuA domain-containing protein [Paenibacillus chibensis]SDK04745.1 Trehalose utilization protein [Paenibacillus typhae]